MAATPLVPDKRCVKVSNLNPTATPHALAEFFSFCGKIASITIGQFGPETALVCFESADAAQTALLLSNALILDRPIQVELVTEAILESSVDKSFVDLGAAAQPNQPASSSAKAAGSSENIPGPGPATYTSAQGKNQKPDTTIQEVDESYTTRNFGCVPDSMRSKTSVVASLIAAGYIMGEDVLKKAREFDQANPIIMQRINEGADIVKFKATEIDVHYQVSTKLKAFGEKVSETAKGTAKIVDAKLGLSETVERALAHPTVSSGINRIKVIGTTIGGAVKSTLEEQKREIEESIEEKHRRRLQQESAKHSLAPEDHPMVQYEEDPIIDEPDPQHASNVIIEPSPHASPAATPIVPQLGV